MCSPLTLCSSGSQAQGGRSWGIPKTASLATRLFLFLMVLSITNCLPNLLGVRVSRKQPRRNSRLFSYFAKSFYCREIGVETGM